MKEERKPGINLPPDVQFLEDLGLLIYRPVGVLSEVSVNKIIRVLGDLEFVWKKPFNRFFDALSHDEVKLNFEYVLHISLYRRLSYSNRPPIKSAILATHSAVIHYARLHKLLTQGSPIKVRIFSSYEEAAHWLGVPVIVLINDGSVSSKNSS